MKFGLIFSLKFVGLIGLLLTLQNRNVINTDKLNLWSSPHNRMDILKVVTINHSAREGGFRVLKSCARHELGIKK